MKNFDSRTYSINDFLEWDKNAQLELAPKFQRRAVWTPSARSFLMDTIVRGKPIPKVFIRQKINPKTQKSIREVVDGQQRLRTILSYVHDGFQISRRHNKRYGGLFFSQLDQVDSEIQANILNYEISVDLLVNMPDEEVLDVFGRLNSYAVILNEQEKIHANHFGPFKTLADEIAHVYNDFWLDNKILTEQQSLRMWDVALTADVLIAMLEGIKSKKRIKFYYSKYEKEFPHDTEQLRERFDHVIRIIRGLFPQSMANSECRRVHIFYSLITAVYHLEFGLPGLDRPRAPIQQSTLPRLSASLERVDAIFNAPDIRALNEDDARFLEASRRATTDEPVRKRRTEFIVDLMCVVE